MSPQNTSILRILSGILLLTIGTLTAQALETPLTLTQPAADTNNRLVTIDEASGAMRLYEIQQGSGHNALRSIAPHNFLIDLDRIRNTRLVIDNPNRVDRRNDPEFVFWQVARTGSFMGAQGRPSNVPLYGEMFQYFMPEQRATVLRSEDLFFESLPAYDGVVRAAMSRSYLMLAIPSSYTLLTYRIIQDTFELVSYRNYRPELYLVVPDQRVRGLPFFGSNPEFNQMHRAVRDLRGGDLLLQQRAQQLDQALEAMDTEESVIPVAPSEPWLHPLSNDRFVMVDAPNSKIMIYEFPQNNAIHLRSLRNFDFDRRIPSWPLPSRDLQEFDRAVVSAYLNRLQRMRPRQDGQIQAITQVVMNWANEARSNNQLELLQIREEDVPVVIFRKLAEQQNLLIGGGGQGRAGRASSSPFDAVVDPGERLVLDLKDERRLMIYLLRGTNNLIELRSSRDYTIETGIAVYDYELSKRRAAATVLAQIEGLARRRGSAVDGLVLANMQYLLSISPSSYQDLEANNNLRRRFGDHELWQPSIEKAMADTQAQEQRIEGLVELVKQEFLSRESAMRAARDRN